MATRGGDAARETGLELLALSQTSTEHPHTARPVFASTRVSLSPPPIRRQTPPIPTPPQGTGMRKREGKDRRGIFPLAWGLAPFPLLAQLGARVRHWGRRGEGISACNFWGDLLMMMERGIGDAGCDARPTDLVPAGMLVPWVPAWTW